MPYSGAGLFTVYVPGTPYVTGTVISSTVANNVNSDFATGLSTAVTKDGQTTTTAVVPFAAGIRLTGTASNLRTGSNFISNDGTDAGLSLDASNAATLSDDLYVVNQVGFGDVPATNRLSVFCQNNTANTLIAQFTNAAKNVLAVEINVADSTGASGTATTMTVQKQNSNSRSINAAGTVNASGADGAEYHTKSATCGEIIKGQIVGRDKNGLLTDKWSECV